MTDGRGVSSSVLTLNLDHNIMPDKQSLTAESFRKLWENELLPSIKSEIQIQLKELKAELEDLKARCVKIEQSQDFLSSKYDQFTEALKNTKRQIKNNEENINKHGKSIALAEDNIDEVSTKLDELQQYSRRDCLEINGIPPTANENPQHLISELGTLIGVEIKKEDISIAHRLPDLKNVKNRIIVKFVRREKKEEMYKRRNQLIGKTVKDLPSVKSQVSNSNETRGPKKIYINESLTGYRRQLLGRINKFKKEKNFKFL